MAFGAGHLLHYERLNSCSFGNSRGGPAGEAHPGTKASWLQELS